MLANHYLAHTDSGSMLLIREGERDGVLDLLVDFYAGKISLQDATWDLENLAIVRCDGVDVRFVTNGGDLSIDEQRTARKAIEASLLSKKSKTS